MNMSDRVLKSRDVLTSDSQWTTSTIETLNGMLDVLMESGLFRNSIIVYC